MKQINKYILEHFENSKFSILEHFENSKFSILEHFENSKFSILERLHINKDTKPAIELDIKKETIFTQKEIDNIYNFADSLKIKPVKIANYYDNEIKHDILYLLYNDKENSILILTKCYYKNEMYFTIVLKSNKQFFSPFSKRQFTGFDTLDELFDISKKRLKDTGFYDNVYYE